MKVTQRTPKTIPVKNLSDYDLSELAALLFQLRSRIHDYGHVTDGGQIENVLKAVISKHEAICIEIDRREDLNY
jgi:hypothetical protein